MMIEFVSIQRMLEHLMLALILEELYDFKYPFEFYQLELSEINFSYYELDVKTLMQE